MDPVVASAFLIYFTDTQAFSMAASLINPLLRQALWSSVTHNRPGKSVVKRNWNSVRNSISVVKYINEINEIFIGRAAARQCLRAGPPTSSSSRNVTAYQSFMASLASCLILSHVGGVLDCGKVGPDLKGGTGSTDRLHRRRHNFLRKLPQQ